MPTTLTLSTSFTVDLLSVISVHDVKMRYLSGIPIPNSISEETLEFFLSSALSEVETYLGLKLSKQVIEETKDFSNVDWRSWGYLRATYPVVHPIQLEGYLGTTKQITYPSTWLSSKLNNDGKSYSRQINLVPTRNSAHSEALIYSGIMPQQQYFMSTNIPNYWTMKYVTGWDTPPSDILDAVGMLMSIKVLQIISDALQSGAMTQVTNAQGQTVATGNGSAFGGIGFGLTSKSVSIDGLSQSYSSYVNGQTGIWGARLKQYTDIMNPKQPGSLLNRLKDQYGGLEMAVA